MARVVIICHVANEHLGTGKDAEAEYGQRLDGELMKMEQNSECGLQVSQCLINDANLYSDKFGAPGVLPARADIEFVWYSEDHAYVQWTSDSSIRGRSAVQRYLRGQGIELGERTGDNQIAIDNDIPLDRIQEIADELDITVYS